jgi:hypothetical protein
MQIKRDRLAKTMYVSQPAYIEEMLAEYNVSVPSTPVLTPMLVPLTKKEVNSVRQALTPDQSVKFAALVAALSKSVGDPLRTKYMQKVGSLLYLAKRTRPDILYAVTHFSRMCQSPTVQDMSGVDRILSYIACTKDKCLTLHSGEGVKLYATVDASYCCHADRKSQSGCTLHIGRNSASFLTITKKQSVTADSSTVAEYIAAHLATKQIMWARNLLSELGFPQSEPTSLFEDNQSTIRLINNKGNGFKTKHIDMRYNFVREQVVDRKTVRMEYLSTNEMTSDMLTKPTGPTIFLKLCAKLLGSGPKAV